MLSPSHAFDSTCTTVLSQQLKFQSRTQTLPGPRHMPQNMHSTRSGRTSPAPTSLSVPVTSLSYPSSLCGAHTAHATATNIIYRPAAGLQAGSTVARCALRQGRCSHRQRPWSQTRAGCCSATGLHQTPPGGHLVSCRQHQWSGSSQHRPLPWCRQSGR